VTKRVFGRLITDSFKSFFKLESAGGILLILTTLAALLLKNSPLSSFYDALKAVPVRVEFGQFLFNYDLSMFVNDGLMTIFFLLVGLEIKREFVEGELSERSQIILPAIAALGGMLVPAIIYLVFNYSNKEALGGWAIPTATDIAFSLTILSLLGNRVPSSLKVFLTALAIFDDLGAILIIALFYHSSFSLIALYCVLALLFVLFVLNRLKVSKRSVYLFVGLLLWAAMYKSGIHATLAGVLLALFVPIEKIDIKEESTLEKLEHSLHPWVSFGIVPLFAFCNAGLDLHSLSAAMLLEPVTMGVFLGLFVGKQIGVFGFSWLIIKSGFAKMPQKSNWLQVYGVSILAGIGFTMSLFIGGLAFSSADYENALKLGVMLGSLLSAVLGYMLLINASKEN
jgi:Na+:H+ antiporter, NhaA family